MGADVCACLSVGRLGRVLTHSCTRLAALAGPMTFSYPLYPVWAELNPYCRQSVWTLKELVGLVVRERVPTAFMAWKPGAAEEGTATWVWNEPVLVHTVVSRVSS